MSPNSSKTWERMLQKVADQLTADGSASVNAAKGIMQAESQRLSSFYSNQQTFHEAIASYIRRSVGVAIDQPISDNVPKILRSMWMQTTQRLREKVQSKILSNEISDFATQAAASQEKMKYLVYVSVMITGCFLLMSLVSLARKYYVYRKTSKAEREVLKLANERDAERKREEAETRRDLRTIASNQSGNQLTRMLGNSARQDGIIRIQMHTPSQGGAHLIRPLLH